VSRKKEENPAVIESRTPVHMAQWEKCQ